jgi:hypothetical protein
MRNAKLQKFLIEDKAQAGRLCHWEPVQQFFIFEK